MLEHINTGEPWRGERINGIAHPRSIETAWDADALQAVGLRVRPVPVPPDPPLDELKTNLSAEVDRDAERVRLKYITAGAGKTLAYGEIKEQAGEVKSDATLPVATDLDQLQQSEKDALEEAYPLISAEIPYRGTNYDAVANVVLGQYQAFRLVEKEVIKTVNAAKSAINAATTVEDANSAYASITWTV